ncbi:VWA domain-containing protein [Singulisphaera sp. PoT]|uniref:VWA domain-containing protein n=1 Tax=Singulisphaera sp. PoT TaxID=3411797 RepID=UPI003BF4F391
MLSLFAHPNRLWLLAFVPFLLVTVLRARQRRARAWKALGQDGRLTGDGGWGWAVAIIFLLLALAQPRWGNTGATNLPPGHDIVIVVDVSRSMGAEDAVPNRLGVAIESAESLVNALSRERGNRVAVVAFAGRGVTRCPLTENLGAAREALRALRPGGVKPGGTDLAAALETAADAFDPEDHAEGKTIILFSDGEDHPSRWLAASQRLRSLGIVAHSVSIGDPEKGHPVPEGAGKPFLSYRGETVLSKRNDKPFEGIAEETGGAVLKVGLASVDLGSLYLKKITPVARRKREAIRPPERTERFSLFILAALISGLAGSWPGSGRLPLFYPWFFGIALIGSIGAGGNSKLPKDWIEAGRKAFASKRFDEALKDFQQASSVMPDHPVPLYDQGAACYQLGQYPEAYASYIKARETADPSLRTKLDYVLGNTALALGDIPGAIRHYDDCLSSRAPGKALDDVRRDAAINRQFAEERAKNPSIPPDADGKQDEGSKRPKPRQQRGGDDESDQSNPGMGDPSDGVPPDDMTPKNRSGAGGAGGGGPNPPKPGSPEAKLASAIENVKQARKSRLEEEEASKPERDKLDW